MPKTAGSSFLASLEEYFKNSLLKDYSDKPFNSMPAKRNAHSL